MTLLDRSDEGRRVCLMYTSDPYTKLRRGAQGTAGFYDSLGTLSVQWDDGSRLGLVPGVDDWVFLTDKQSSE